MMPMSRVLPRTIEPPTTMTTAMATPVSVTTIGTITCAYFAARRWVRRLPWALSS